jgi:hypothetical protein
MTPNDRSPRELTADELRAVCDRHRRAITAEDLIEYVEDDAPKVPASVILADIDAFLAGLNPSETPA